MISRSASYAVRALTFLAKKPADAWTLNREIASDLALPPQFLTKILGTLATHGILLSQRGKTGGFKLARPSDEITLLEIVEAFDAIATRRPCLLGQTVCSDETSCPLHTEWKAACDSMVEAFRSRTLADISVNLREGGFPRPGAGVR